MKLKVIAREEEPWLKNEYREAYLREDTRRLIFGQSESAVEMKNEKFKLHVRKTEGEMKSERAREEENNMFWWDGG